MVKALTALVLGISLLTANAGCQSAPFPIPPADAVMAKHLRHSHVQVKTEYGSGSGSVFLFDSRRYGRVAFVLTAEHVTRGGEEFFAIRQGEAPDGKPYKPEWAEAFLVAEDARMDLSVLVVFNKKFVKRFKHTTVIGGDPRVGDTLHHVGSFLGDNGFNSYSKGKLAYLYRGPETNGSAIHLHQMTAPAFPGSSGGGVYDSQGLYVGTLVRGYDATFSMFVPTRFLKHFLVREGLGFLVNPLHPEGDKWHKRLH